MRLLLYARDTTVPQHEIRWNWIVDLPFGKGKLVGKNARGVAESADRRLAGQRPGPLEHQLEFAADGYRIRPARRCSTTATNIPSRIAAAAACLPGYLLWNGYIPAHQINSHDPKTGQPNGVMGVPSDYKPAASPLWPYPADYNSRSGTTDPNYDNYGSNIVFLPVTDSTTPYQIDLTPYNSGPRPEALYLPGTTSRC